MFHVIVHLVKCVSGQIYFVRLGNIQFEEKNFVFNLQHLTSSCLDIIIFMDQTYRICPNLCKSCIKLPVMKYQVIYL